VRTAGGALVLLSCGGGGVVPFTPPGGGDAGAGPTIEDGALPPARVGDPYETRIQAAGGAGALVFSIVGGDLPEGLALARDGTVSGTPAAAGSSEFEVEVVDDVGRSDRADLSIDVVHGVDLVTERLPPTELGAAYDVALEVTGGAAPVDFSIARGEVPPGIALAGGGRIAGAGTADGSWTFTVRVDAADGSFDEERYVLHVVDGLVAIGSPGAVIGDACALPGETETVAYSATLEIERSGSLVELDVYVDVEYANMGYLALVLTSPDGDSVLLRGYEGPGGGPDGGIETIFDEEDEPAGTLAVYAGDNPAGTWTLTAHVHRVEPEWVGECPGEGRIAGFGLLLRFDASSDDYLRAGGWFPNNLFAEPWARVTGGGQDMDEFTMDLRRWTAGANGVREAGEGDDVDGGPLAVTWTTNLRPEQGGIDPVTGTFRSGGETGRRAAEVEASGPGLIFATEVDGGGGAVHEFAIRVVAPDWVP
jgi:hypothetical protein